MSAGFTLIDNTRSRRRECVYQKDGKAGVNKILR